MFFKTSLVAAVVAGFVSLPAIAWAAQPYHPANTEQGFITHQAPSQATRESVLQELADWRAYPVASDGWRDVSGELGWQRELAPTQAAPGTERLSSAISMPSASPNPWVWVGGEKGWELRPGS